MKELWIGLASAVVGAVAGATAASILTPELFRNDFPTAVLAELPDEIGVGAPITLSARASSDPEGEPLEFRWRVNGAAPERSHDARCTADADRASLTCQFLLARPHAIDVEVADVGGATDAATAVIVATRRGAYAALVVAGVEGERRATLERALLLAVDWRAVQAELSAPLMLYDPDLPGPTTLGFLPTRDVEAARAAAEASSAASLRIAAAGMTPEGRRIIEEQSAEAGLFVRMTSMPSGEIFQAATAGSMDGGVVPVDGPSAFQALRDSF